MARYELPPEFRSRPATVDDARSVAAIIAASEASYGSDTVITADAVRHFWSTVDLTTQSIIVQDPDGEIVAAAEIDNHDFRSISIYGQVHPDYRGRGIGSYIVAWSERWMRDRIDLAPPDATVAVQQLLSSRNEPGRRLLEGAGYTQVRQTLTMGIDLASPPPPPVWPEGVARDPFVAGRDEREVYEVVEETFEDVWGRTRNSFQRFLTNRPSRRDEADLWVIARIEGEIAGVSLGKLLGETGWIDNVGVRRPYRRRGIGLALLQESFCAYHRRGVPDVRLKVDATSLTGATRLYERAGMSVMGGDILMQKTLR
ncbi:GNAT family N-acetyltransferase [soil metagenome]